ncbi:MAG TPA: AMP-binding protein [Methylomirabilota bacterium]|nr:AMP-binding protein [Methylomirabilota bacterium]
MDPIWKRFWPPGLDEAAIRLPTAPITHFLSTHARRQPDKPALVFYGRVVTYGELDTASDRVAGWLRARGIVPGDRVALYLENSPQFAIAYYGILKAGAVAVALNVMHKALEVEHQLADSGARLLVAADTGYATVEPVRGRTALEAVAVTRYADFLPPDPTLPVPPAFHEPARPTRDTDDLAEILRTAPAAPAPYPARPAEPAVIQYTSGTTGAPKGAVLTHGNLTANCELRRCYGGFTGGDVILGVLPWFHITGMESQLNGAMYLGNTLITLGRFDVETVLTAIERYRPTVTTFITTINVAILNYAGLDRFDLSSLRATYSGGAPVPAEVARRWEAVTGCPLIEGYGLTETTSPTHGNPRHRPKYGTVGLPLPLTDAKVVSLADGVTELPVGASGEVVVRGPQVMQGYWRNPAATAEVLRDGWLSTGDIGHVDEEGYFVLEERKKDLIKASGYSVFPAEVEALMYRHPAVAEVGVVGAPDPYRGEDVVAFVVLRSEARGRLTEEELIAWCRAEMAVYKAPRRVRFVDALPKTASGKILKRALRAQITSLSADPSSRP